MSGTWPISGLEACNLIKDGYRPDRGNLSIVQEINIRCVHAFIVNTNNLKALLIQGTNENPDWCHYNILFWPCEDKRDGPGLCWHGGFLHYAQIVYAFAKYKNVDVVLGHSLGEAAAQILGVSLGVPTIAVASPRALFIQPGKEEPAHVNLVMNLCRKDDAVCHVPLSWWGHSHIGNVHWLDPHRPNPGLDHDIKHYIKF